MLYRDVKDLGCCIEMSKTCWLQVRGLKDTLGFNLAAMRHLTRAHKSATAVMGDDEPDAVRPVKRRRMEPQ